MSIRGKKPLAVRPKKFFIGHSFWDKAVELTQAGERLSSILARAHLAGYDDLTFSDIRYGLNHAPADLNLPLNATVQIRKRFEKLTETFNAYVTLKDLVNEALKNYSDIDDELESFDPLTSDRNIRARVVDLTSERTRWFDRAATLAKQIADIEMKLTGIDGGQGSVKDENPEEVREWMTRIAHELSVPRIPDRQIVEICGADNIRTPTDDDVIEVEIIDDGLDEEAG